MLRFVISVIIGAAIGAGTFFGFFGGHIVEVGVAKFFAALAVMTLAIGVATWLWSWAGGAGMVVGLAFGYTPVFGLWAADHVNGLWATWMIMALGGMLIYGLTIITVVYAIDMKIRGYHPDDTAAGLDLPTRVATARRASGSSDADDELPPSETERF
ncbi:hypothetical protein ACFPVT_08865 [Corynebacterium choanae]|uniref:hypothetical protein n=1 Tax=Corynebacterium choanae TaxID=1862358 RepID=UPI000F4F9A93|nr:hypothetical protein [Corynebacterium choanae]